VAFAKNVPLLVQVAQEGWPEAGVVAHDSKPNHYIIGW
jgi:hypothetical protein